MRSKLTSLLLLGVVADIAVTFKVDFYLGAECRGQALGDWVGGKDQGCIPALGYVLGCPSKSRLTRSRSQASTAIIQSTGAVDDDTFVQFYSSDNCQPGTETVGSPAACIAIEDSIIGAYGSFQVVDVVVAPPLTPDATITVTELATATPASGSLEKREMRHGRRQERAPDAVPTDSIPLIYHGVEAHVDDVPFKWHQVYEGGFLAVPTEEWDDNIHMPEYRSLRELAIHAGVEHKHIRTRDVSPAPFSPVPLSPLEERALFDSFCQAKQTCVQLANAISVGDVYEWIVDEAATYATAARKSVWAMLTSQAFSTQLIACEYRGLLDGWVTNTPPATAGGLISSLANNQAAVIRALGNISSQLQCSNEQVPGDLAAANALGAAIVKEYLSQIELIDIAIGLEVTVERITGDSKEGYKVKLNTVGCNAKPEGGLQKCGLQTGFCSTTTTQGS